MIKIANLTKKYGEKVAVDNLSIEIPNGEICAFIGHNGAGKTTTIKCLVGIQEADSGEFEIDGASLKTSELEYKKKIAYIPDTPEAYDFMTGNAYLNFIADVFRISLEERKSAIEKYSKLFEMQDVLNNNISSYSHGMKQKIVLISALIHSPKVLILDEPFVGLDPKSSHSLKQVMHEFCQKGGAIFFSTHVLDVAEKLCDTVAVISNGKLVAYDKMANIVKDKSLETIFLEIEK